MHPMGSDGEAHPTPGRHGLTELARVFLKLGVIGFGGPAAHLAMMDDEVVERRQWLSREHFLDLVGATNLIPGPNSSEMTMHIGYERGGIPGLVVAGSCFILPAVLITGVAAWAYVTYGSLPAVEPLLFGIKPAVLSVILGAVWKLGRTAVAGWRLGVLGAGVLIGVLAGVGEIPALFAGGVIGMVWLRLSARPRGTASSLVVVPFLTHPPSAGASALAVGAAGAAATVSLWQLGFFFLKVGAVLYGSGYVLVAFLEGGLVEQFGWLTRAELLDAIALGQLTPGPILSTATFVGFLLHGAPGAAVATVGVFLPSFVFVLALNPVIPRLRTSAWMSAFLDAVNVAAVALMLAVTIQLGATVLVSWPAWVIALAAAVVVLWFRVNAAWAVLGGALVGYPLGLLA